MEIVYLRENGKYYKQTVLSKAQIEGLEPKEYEEYIKTQGKELISSQEYHQANPKPTIEKPLKLNLRLFMLQLLGTPLFDELNTYLKNYPTLVEFTKDGILTQDEVTKLLEHLDLHLEAQIVSQDLYNVIKGALTNEGEL